RPRWPEQFWRRHWLQRSRFGVVAADRRRRPLPRRHTPTAAPASPSSPATSPSTASASANHAPRTVTRRLPWPGNAAAKCRRRLSVAGNGVLADDCSHSWTTFTSTAGSAEVPRRLHRHITQAGYHFPSVTAWGLTPPSAITVFG